VLPNLIAVCSLSFFVKLSLAFHSHVWHPLCVYYDMISTVQRCWTVLIPCPFIRFNFLHRWSSIFPAFLVYPFSVTSHDFPFNKQFELLFSLLWFFTIFQINFVVLRSHGYGGKPMISLPSFWNRLNTWVSNGQFDQAESAHFWVLSSKLTLFFWSYSWMSHIIRDS
jgi:hypothetical protein